MNITVTKPFFPPLANYQAFLQGIWAREWLTNNGPLVNELELKLKERLELDHLLFLSNGTIALQLALRALDLAGEVITTPFSYVATTSSIVWERCIPVMADISPETWNIDPARIEAVITERTVAILATHVFGNPCEVEAIEAVAKRHGLKVIYDAAHAFGSRYKGRSLLSYGDISTCSFHATKLFHTIEGGAVVTPDASLLKRMAMMRNFGHISPYEFGEVGINGKNSEVHAAMGLCNLPYIETILSNRAEIHARYVANLRALPVAFQKILPDTDYNHSYIPILFESERVVLKVHEQLSLNSVFTRRYFYPSLSKLPYVVGQHTPIAEEISRRVLCLPSYHTLSFEEVDMICRIVSRVIRFG